MLSKWSMCFLNQGFHVHPVMSTVLEKDGTFSSLVTCPKSSGLASPIPDLKHHQSARKCLQKIKQPRKPKAISRNPNPGPDWSGLDNFCRLWKQKCKECLRNSWKKAIKKMTTITTTKKKGEVDVKKQTWCAGNNSALAGKRPPPKRANR